MVNRGDGSVLGIAPDNDGNKSVMARLMIRPVDALNVGGSFAWGRHPQSKVDDLNFLGATFVDTKQAPTWRADAHLDLNLDEVQAHVVGLRFPVLPRFTLKAEYAFVREDGGRSNRLYNDNFQFQAVADF